MTRRKIEYVAVESVYPDPKNPNEHSEEQVDQIANSIKEFGWTQPILVDEDYNIIAGHGRYMAANALEMTDVPVIVLAGLSEAQRRAYLLADNKLAQNAEWNFRSLKDYMHELRDMDFDVSLTGFSDKELHDFFREDTSDTEDRLPEEVPARAKAGEIWKLGTHRILCGDSTNREDVERLLSGEVPHLMVTDPPYGVDYDPAWRADVGVNKNTQKLGRVDNDDRADWTDAWHQFPGDVAYVWHADKYAALVSGSLAAAHFEIRSQIIWAKDRMALSRGHYHWQHEPCWYAVRGEAHWQGDRSQTTVWNIAAREDKGFGHGTQKPVECMRRPIVNNSAIGDAVYDPFVGSGTTLVAAETEGRRCYAMEIDPKYCDVVIARWEQFTGKKARRVKK